MKRKILLIAIPVLMLMMSGACALEIANVIGPGGGYVFYDKGNYDQGWRYLECAPFDICELKDVSNDSIKKAVDECEKNSGGWYSFPWELPNEANMKKMLECFSYGLTRFSPDFYYLTFNELNGYDPDEKDLDNQDPDSWEAVILHKSFDKKANGEVERAPELPEVIRVRPIRKF